MTLREIERQSIHSFIERAGADGYITGRVLDYGCGKQPYRSLVESYGAKYVGFDHPDLPASVAVEPLNARPPIVKNLVDDAYLPDVGGTPLFDVVLCTQVLQYVPDVPDKLSGFRALMHDQGHLVLTYPTHWPEVEPEDLWRFTKAGMERLLIKAGFEIVRHERRHEMVNRDGTWAIGYGVIARA